MADDADTTTANRAWIVPICAAGFALLFIVGLLMAGMVSDTQDKTDAEALKHFDDNKTVGVISAYVLVVAGLAFLPVARAMTTRIAASASALAVHVARSAALIFSAMVIVGGIVFASMSAAVSLGGEDTPPVELIRFIPQIGFGMVLLAGALSVAVFLVIVSRAGQTGGAIAKWFAILGYVAAVAMLAGVLFVPMILLPIWAIAAAFQLRGEPA
jgi:hypothetical protein